MISAQQCTLSGENLKRVQQKRNEKRKTQTLKEMLDSNATLVLYLLVKCAVWQCVSAYSWLVEPPTHPTTHPRALIAQSYFNSKFCTITNTLSTWNGTKSFLYYYYYYYTSIFVENI